MCSASRRRRQTVQPLENPEPGADDMAVEIVIRVDEGAVSVDQRKTGTTHGDRPSDYSSHDLIEMMGDDIKPFPSSRIGGYMSHFRIVIELLTEPSRIVSIVSPLAAQAVSWSDPFVYEGPQARHAVDMPLPASSALPTRISEDDFIEKPEEFFVPGKETIWLQILNLDAKMDTEIGPVRIILGETIKREYPDLFRPSLGAAQSLGRSGFPAKLFFNPYAIIETPLGAFRAIHGVLSYGRVTNFPPIGTPVTIRNCIPLDHVDEIREMGLDLEHSKNPKARIIALTHPIDMELQLPSEHDSSGAQSELASGAAPSSAPSEAPYHFVERLISGA
jgi:hypothetical protein